MTQVGLSHITREAFRRTLLLGCDSEARVLEPDFKQHFEMWREALFIASEVFQQSTGPDEDPKRSEKLLQLHALTSRSSEFSPCFNERAIGRKFFISSRGYMGWLPSAAQESDSARNL